MFRVLGPGQTAQATAHTQQPQVKEITQPLQQTSLDHRVQEPTSEMPREQPNDRASASGDDWKTVKNPRDERRERHPRTVSGTAAGGHHGGYWTDRGQKFWAVFRERTARLKSLESDHRQLTDEYETLRHNRRRLYEARQVALTDLSEAQTTCKKQQQQIDVLKGKLHHVSAFLEVRNQEAKVAKAFLSKEDPISASDVSQFVRDLNSEIMQTAAYLAENLPLNRTHIPLVEEIPESPYKSIFVTLVLPQVSGEEPDVGSLELALQGFLAFSASGIAGTWGFSHASRRYDELYSKVRETGA